MTLKHEFTHLIYNPFKYGLDIDIRFNFDVDVKYKFMNVVLVFLFFRVDYYCEVVE